MNTDFVEDSSWKRQAKFLIFLSLTLIPMTVLFLSVLLLAPKRVMIVFYALRVRLNMPFYLYMQKTSGGVGLSGILCQHCGAVLSSAGGKEELSLAQDLMSKARAYRPSEEELKTCSHMYEYCSKMSRAPMMKKILSYRFLERRWWSPVHD